MFQQVIALIIIAFFLARLFWQKQKKQIAASDFIFWLIFWLLSAGAVIFLKWIDKLVADLGFSGSGIEVLLYLGVAILFYFIFRLRLRLEKIEQDITKIVREISLSRAISQDVTESREDNYHSSTRAAKSQSIRKIRDKK